MNFRTLATFVIVTMLVSSCFLIDRAIAGVNPDGTVSGRCTYVPKSPYCNTVACGATGAPINCQNGNGNNYYCKVDSTPTGYSRCDPSYTTGINCDNIPSGKNNTHAIDACYNRYFLTITGNGVCTYPCCTIVQEDLACN